MKKLIGIISIITVIGLLVGPVIYKKANTTTLTYTEVGSTKIQYLTIPQGDAWNGWSTEDCYLHTAYDYMKAHGQVIPKTFSQDRVYELSTSGEVSCRKSLLIGIKKIHIISIS